MCKPLYIIFFQDNLSSNCPGELQACNNPTCPRICIPFVFSPIAPSSTRNWRKCPELLGMERHMTHYMWQCWDNECSQMVSPIKIMTPSGLKITQDFYSTHILNGVVLEWKENRFTFKCILGVTDTFRWEQTSIQRKRLRVIFTDYISCSFKIRWGLM